MKEKKFSNKNTENKYYELYERILIAVRTFGAFFGSQETVNLLADIIKQERLKAKYEEERIREVRKSLAQEGRKNESE